MKDVLLRLYWGQAFAETWQAVRIFGRSKRWINVRKDDAMTRNIALTAVTGGALIAASLTACRPAIEQVLPDVANAAFVVDGNRYLLQAG